METNHEIKEAVKEKYGQIARGEVTSCAPTGASSCCGTGDASVVNMALKYEDADRATLPEGADLGLGCGTPAAFAELREGMTVLDLGSGAGIDCFIAAQHVGATGRVIGVDMTADMIVRANANKAKVAAANVEFRLGDIEALPVEAGTIDRVLSNCVINLVPDKAAAFGEMFRVLKSGGGFTVSDIVVDGVISDEERRNASLWAGCISGAMDRKEYLDLVRRAGFAGVQVVSEKRYDYKLQSNGGLSSITVSAIKP